MRYTIVAMLFLATVINYADRATLSIAGSALARDFALQPLQLGVVFSAFGWAYVLAQLPGGLLLDKFGSERVYFVSIAAWSVLTLLQGAVHALPATAALSALFVLRFLVGIAEAPSFPGNARIVTTWFPTSERGIASAIFNSAQYFATIVFAPIMAWITLTYGWPYVFYFMGVLGCLFSVAWQRFVYSPLEHPRLQAPEFEYIASGGAIVDADTRARVERSRATTPRPDSPLCSAIIGAAPLLCNEVHL